MKNIVSIVALQAVSVGGIVSDYCLVSQDRCDKDGIYKYKWITSYQDFIIRDKLDSELENIKKDPWLALKRSQQTVETNPNRWVPDTQKGYFCPGTWIWTRKSPDNSFGQIR